MKHQDVIAKLSLDEKCYLLSGRDFWSTVDIRHAGIPAICLSDGPHGVRKQEGAGDQLGLNGSIPATCFPTAATIANSWNETLGEEIGQALGEEAAVQDVEVLLGPGMNIKRSPLCGRNFEYFSEDPYLAGKMAASYIKGIQSRGVSACPKHFAANNSELRRQSSDSIVDERTFREIYLTAFEIAVREARPKSIMSSYNAINGTYANENAHLLQEILREEWGFDGFVVTDWGGDNDFTEGVRAGSNLEMPSTGGDGPEQLIRDCKAGKISESLIDQRVDELLDVVFATRAGADAYKGKKFDVDAHHTLAQRASEESIVLLKNEENILPLAKNSKVAVIGEFAKEARYQGAGSSVVNSTKLDHAMSTIKDYDFDVVGHEPGYPRFGAGDAEMQKKAVALAKRADYVLLHLGLDEISESEGLDRANMKLPKSQIDLLDAIYQVNQNIIVIMSAGSAIEMPWLPKCKALIHGYLCGQAGARAMHKALLGEINPSGKLSETYPIKYEDVSSAPYFPAPQRTVEYREGLYVGYRYFESAKIPVLFPFGHGLSYTTFEYSDIRCELSPACKQKVKSNTAVGKVTFTLTNTGDRDGAEVAQVYIQAKNPSIYRPAKELKGFAKVFLKAGQSKEVTIPLDDKAFRYFNVETDRFEIDGGDYEILVGASVADVRLAQTVTVSGTGAPIPANANIEAYKKVELKQVSDADFEKLLGHAIPDGTWGGTLRMNDAICQLYYAKSLKARLVYKVMTSILNKSLEKGKPDLNIIFIYNMPFRAIGKMAGGMVSQKMCQGIVTIINGHAIAFFKGVGTVIGGFFEQRRISKKAKKIGR